MDIQPIEKNTLSFFLFYEKEDLMVQIDKPEGIEKADFELKQNNNGYGRYLTFADEIDVVFTPRRNQEFKKLCELYRLNKWQNSVYLIMKIKDVELIRARLKFENAQTDYLYEFRIKIDINNQREIIEAKKTTSVNLMSDKSVDEKEITPIELSDVLTRFKHIYIDQSIYLDRPDFPFIHEITGVGEDSYFHYFILNPFNKSQNSSDFIDIGDGFLIRNWPSSQSGYENRDKYTYFKNKESVSNLNVKISDIDINFSLDRIPIVRLICILENYNSDGTFINQTIFYKNAKEANDRFQYSFEEKIELQPFQRIVYFFQVGRDRQNDSINGTITFNKKPKIQFFSVSQFENTTTKSSRLINIGKQCLKSITNNSVTVIAPRFTNSNGNFYDIFATSGLFLRQYEDQPFNATWKNFTDYIRSSFNCDYQINGDEVFFGHQIDFYQDKEVGRLLFSPNKDSYKVSPNENIMKSGFKIEYDKYEDDKASSNTIDSIHVSSELYLSNSEPLQDANDENNIKYVADQYMIENIRRESFNKDSTKTVPNDKEIYVIDTIMENGKLQNRSNQGLFTENIYSPETAYNLRLSIKRLMIDYFSEHLANVAQFTKNVISWKATNYLNNREAKTKPSFPLSVKTKNIELVEGADITPDQLPSPFLNGDVYNFDCAYRFKFNDCWDLINNILENKGYITFYTETGTEIKIFVQNLKYNWENEKLYNIKGERKYE